LKSTRGRLPLAGVFYTNRESKEGFMKSFMIAAFIAVAGMALQAAIRFSSFRDKMVAYQEELLFIIFFVGAALVISCLIMLMQQQAHIAYQKLRIGRVLNKSKK
jgi:hypothetical protein